MKKFKISICLCLFLSSFSLIAQDSIQVPQIVDRISFGIGGGLDYGGFGANVLVYPHKNIGVFGGTGYALDDIDFYAGAKFRISSKNNNIDHYALVMYGYNAIIAVKHASNFNKIFYGPTVGFGLDFRSKQLKKGYWTMALLIPIRSSVVHEYMDDLESNYSVKFKNGLYPIAISIGYRIISK